MSKAETEPFLPPQLEARLDKFEHVDLLASDPNGQYVDPLRRVYRNFPAIMQTTSLQRLYLYRHGNTPLNSGHTSQTLPAALEHHGFAIVLSDLEHETYRQMTVLATGFSQAQGNDSIINHGFELGKKIITERAHKIALALAISGVMTVNPIVETDDMTLIDRAHNVYANTSLNPSATIPKPEGDRLDALLRRIWEGDFAEPQPSKYIPTGKGLLGRVGTGVKTAKAIKRMIQDITDPDKTVEILEEAYDTFLRPPFMDITDKDAEFIARTVAKLCAYIGRAATVDEVIAGDRRVPFIKFLTSRLTKHSVSGELSAFQKAVSKVAKAEKAQSS